MDSQDIFSGFDPMSEWNFMPTDDMMGMVPCTSTLSYPSITESPMSELNLDYSYVSPPPPASEGDWWMNQKFEADPTQQYATFSSNSSSAAASPSTEAVSPQPRASRGRKSKKVRSTPAANERRYRVQLIDRIMELGRCVPTVQACEHGEWVDEEKAIPGLAPARNGRKPTILAKAVEYIQYLEAQNKQLQADLQSVSPACR